MKAVLILSIFAFSSVLHAAEPTVEEQEKTTILHSYQKEVSFLNSYRFQLNKKLKNLGKQTESETTSGRSELQKLEVEWLNLQTRGEDLATKLANIEQENEEGLDSKKGLDAIVEQATLDLKGIQFKEEMSLVDKVTLSFGESLAQLQKLQTVSSSKGHFFDKKGRKVEGEVVSYGGISRYGVSESSAGLLYPVGSGEFRIWESMSKSAVAQIQKNKAKTLPLFIFESAQVAFSKPESKSTLQTIQAGGLIAWVLVLMGLVAIAMSGLRFMLLKKSQIKDESVLDDILEHVGAENYDQAISVAQNNGGSVTQVLKNTILCFKNKTEEAIDDVITESILHESILIDRFGTILTIIASVATLLGLLGTVTGMINTFEMITEYGNTNPKMLSGGISEALITTKFGLIVAIPTMLVGQVLSSWNEKIKTQMEEYALAVCNRVKNGSPL